MHPPKDIVKERHSHRNLWRGENILKIVRVLPRFFRRIQTIQYLSFGYLCRILQEPFGLADHFGADVGEACKLRNRKPIGNALIFQPISMHIRIFPENSGIFRFSYTVKKKNKLSSIFYVGHFVGHFA